MAVGGLHRSVRLSEAGRCHDLGSDPFFFDVDGALNTLQFTGKDVFADKNICSIVLADDVVATFMPLLTNGKVTTDNVDPHTDLLPEFPYVAPPHRGPEAVRRPTCQCHSEPFLK